MKTRSMTFCAGMFTAAALATIGCAADGSGVDSTNDEVVGVLDLDDSVTVNEDNLTFDANVASQLDGKGILSKLEAYAAASDKKSAEPVFLVGNRRKDAAKPDGTVNESSRNAYGYLRRGVSYSKGSKGEIIVKTEPAAITEAYAELAARGFVTVSEPKSIRPLNAGDLTESETTSKIWSRKWENETFGGPRTFDLLKMKLKDKSGNEFSFGDTPLLKFDQGGFKAELRMKSAFIKIEPSSSGEVNVRGLKTNDGFVSLSAKASSELVFEAEASGIAEPSRSGTFHIVNLVGAAGGFPTTLRVDADWKCELHASAQAKATFGGKANGAISAKASFKDFKLATELPKPTYGFEMVGPDVEGSAKVIARCEITPKLALGVFDALGPEAALNLWSQLDADASMLNATGSASAKLTAGGELRFGGGLRPFGFDLLTIDAKPVPLFETKIFDKKIEKK